MRNLTKKVSALLMGLGALCAAPAAMAADWPAKPVSLVVAYPPGGVVDLMGRVLADELSKRYNTPFIVSNRAGANGQVAALFVADQAPDGYTFLLGATGHVVAPAVQKDVRYHPVNSFEPIALLGSMPNILVLAPETPANNFDEFVAWAKTQKFVPYASSGVGGGTHLSGEFFRHATDLPLTHVPYKGGAPAMADLLAGHVPSAFMDAVTSFGPIKDGKIKAIAVTTARRSIAYPDVPTVAELGFPDYDFGNWVGMYAPAKTPADISTEINGALNEILASPHVKKRIEEMGMDIIPMNVAEFRTFVEDEMNKWATSIRDAGIEIDSN